MPMARSNGATFDVAQAFGEIDWRSLASAGEVSRSAPG